MPYITDGFDERVIKILKNGGVGFMPSDTIYGLSCRALDKKAVMRIHRLKERDEHKPFIVLISSLMQLLELGVNTFPKELVNDYWPGALTIIFDAPKAPQWLQLGTKTLAVRLPNDEDLRDLINEVGPLVSTSANIQARRPAKSVEEARRYFGGKLDFYIDAGLIENPPSTIIELHKGKLRVVRQGSIKI